MQHLKTIKEEYSCGSIIKSIALVTVDYVITSTRVFRLLYSYCQAPNLVAYYITMSLLLVLAVSL